VLNINLHVERLGAYQPFDAVSSQLYAEYVKTEKSDHLQTQALRFVQGRLDEPEIQLVVLTGDAGHGKTHLCGQLLSGLDESITDPSEYLKGYGSGKQRVLVLPDGRDLFIIKDLSEHDDETGARLLEASLSSSDRITLVCANEGKLRKVLGRAAESARPLREALNGVLESGQTSQEGGNVHVVDLNHQSIAAKDGDSLAKQALSNWAVDRRKWTTCESCDARDSCPIYENHRLLSADDSFGRSRRAGVETLLRLIEETGHVVTIRELLVFIAYGITGGLRCKDVHEQVRIQKSNWQGEYLFHQVMFATQLTSAELNQFRVFRAASMLDPANRAIRPVDDALAMGSSEDSDHRYQPAELDADETPKNARQIQDVAKRHRNAYAFLRRQDYFECNNSADTVQVSFTERLGLRFYDDFEKVLEADVPKTELVPTRDKLLSGIEAIQGVRRHRTAGQFFVVDPAFSSHRGAAAVISQIMASGKIELISQSRWWELKSERGPNLHQAIDWLDRRVFVLLDDGEAPGEQRKPIALELDCRQFEFVCRSAEGLTNRAFYQADIRRVMAKLADMAQPPSASGTIAVLFAGRPINLVIDTGDVIQVTET
jgi:hypothetical protein